MRRIISTMTIIFGFLSFASSLFATSSKIKNVPDDDPQKMIRVFLNTGDTKDFNVSEIDSITTTTEEQRIWHAGEYESFAFESIDSIWYIYPSLKLSVNDLGFGKVAVGNEKTMAVAFTNTGEYTESYILLADGVFSAEGSGQEFVIDAGESVNLNLTFKPANETSYYGSLMVYSSSIDEGMLELPLTGKGVATTSEEEGTYLPPVEQDFNIILPEDVSINDFEGFKIVNFYGEYPVEIHNMVNGMRTTKRAGTNSNSFSSPAFVSQNGLQHHTFVDSQGNPFFYSITIPYEQPEISFTETALSLLVSTPYLIPKNDAEYKNTVRILKSLNSFPDFVQQVRNAYYEGKKHNQCPDYSNISTSRIINELFTMTKDVRDMTFSGVTLTNQYVTPISAKFRLHNDFKRVIHAYTSRVKMNETNLVVTEKEDASVTFLDLINELIDTGINYEVDNIKDQIPSLDVEDMEYIQELKAWIQEIEEEEMARNPALGKVFHFHLPYILESPSANYLTIVCDAIEIWFMGGDAEKSIFEAESPDLEVPYNGYDKIFVDIYGLGFPGNKSWNSYTEEEQGRIILALMWGAYTDVIKPFWEMVTGFNSAIETRQSNFNYDFRYGARKYPEFALVLKLFQEFCKNRSNLKELDENLDKHNYKAVFEQLGLFALKELIKMPSEDSNDKRTYTNLIYNIYKKYAGKTATSAAFKQTFKSTANEFLSKINFIFKFVEVCEHAVDFVGGVNDMLQSELKQTFVIDKSQQPYINVIEPKEVLSAINNKTIHFEWDIYMASHYGKCLYDLVLAFETPDNYNQITYMSNINETNCDVNFASVPESRSANRVLFKLIARDSKNANIVLTETDFIPLASSLSSDTPEFIDLGLPSGTLWALCNLGATQSTTFGDYYAWGETTTKSSYSWKNYKYCQGTNNSLTKYCTKAHYGNNNFTDNLTELQGSDDPLSIKYGYYYCIPTKEDWEELITFCNWSLLNGCAYVRSQTNGNVIFLPMAGYRSGVNLYDDDKNGYYWTSTLDPNSPDDAWFIYIGNGKANNYDYYRSHGRSIRPVLKRYKTSNTQAPAHNVPRPLEKKGDNGLMVKCISHSSSK